MGRIKELSSATPTSSDSFVFDGAKGTKKISLEALERKLIEDGVGNGTLISQINQNVTDMVPSSALLYAMNESINSTLTSLNDELSEVSAIVNRITPARISASSRPVVNVQFKPSLLEIYNPLLFVDSYNNIMYIAPPWMSNTSGIVNLSGFIIAINKTTKYPTNIYYDSPSDGSSRRIKIQYGSNGVPTIGILSLDGRSQVTSYAYADS